MLKDNRYALSKGKENNKLPRLQRVILWGYHHFQIGFLNSSESLSYHDISQLAERKQSPTWKFQ